MEEFRLGYVPWKNDFYNDLSKKYSEEEISLTGLYYKSDKTGELIDRFNSRIIFPVNNIAGDTIAFGGRIIRDGKLAKYINSPETEFYKKGNIIFNLDKAKNSDAVLLASVGTPKYDNNKREEKPEFGLLALRKYLDLYINVRPIFVFNS